MTYETFLQQILDLGIKPTWYLPEDLEENRYLNGKDYYVDHSWNSDNYYEYKKYNKKTNKVLPTPPVRYISVTWETGGTSGGDWRDDSEVHAFTNYEPVPELEDFDKILEHFTPTIGFLKYKRLMASCVETSSWTVNEYYGNSSNKMAKYVDLEKLYNELNKDELLGSTSSVQIQG